MSTPEIRSFRIVKNEPLCDGSFLLGLEPADDKPTFSFVAGQWVMVHLAEPDQSLEQAVATRSTWRGAFSIASAPSESKDGIELAIKVYGDFTKRLQRLQPFEIVALHGPFGVFTLRPGTDRLVIFAAGIGMTPFRSMIREMLLTNDPREIVLIYTNRMRGDIAFEEDLRDFAGKNPRVHVHFLLTRESPPSWDGEVGRLDEEKMNRLIPSVEQTEFLMCGPVDFMENVAALLAKRGVDVKKKLRKELFN